MSRIEEVNSSVVLMLKLYDGRTDRYVRARVFNSTGVEVSGSPFSLSHDASGRYRSTGWTPTLEGQYTVEYMVYSDAGFTTLDPRYNQIVEQVDVRSLDQDLATLLSRLTATRASNLDFLDVAVSSRQSAATALTQYNQVIADIAAVQADTDDIQLKIGTPTGGSVAVALAAIQADTDDIQSKIGSPATTLTDAIAAVQADTDDIQLKIGSPAGGDLGTAIASVKSDTSGLRTDYTTVRASYLDNLDATITSRQAETDALSRYNQVISDIAAVQADTDDIQLKIGTPAGGSVATAIAGVQSDTDDIQIKIAAVQADTDSIEPKIDAIKLQTDKFTFTSTNVNANTQVNSDKTGYELTNAERIAIGGAVWDTARTGHTGLDTFGLYLDVAISSRESEGDALSRYGNITSDIAGVQSDTNDIQSKIGTPAGGSVATAIAAVQADTDDIQSKIGSPTTTLTAAIADVQADTDDIQSKIGSPAGGSVAVAIAAVKTDTGAIKLQTDKMTFNLSNSIYSEVTGLTLNPADLQTIADAVWESLAVNHNNSGTFGEALNHSHIDVELILTRLGSPVLTTFSLDIQSIQTDTNDIQSKIGAPAGGDLGTAIASVKSDTSGLRTDYTTVRAGLIDHLDADITTRQAETDALSRYNQVRSDIALVETEADALARYNQVRSDISGVQSDTDDIQTKIGTPSGGSVATATAAIKADTAAIKLQTDKMLFNGSSYIIAEAADISLNPAELQTIADSVWKTSIVAPTAGSYGELIQDIDAEVDVIHSEVLTMPFNIWEENLGLHGTPGTSGQMLYQLTLSAIAYTVWEELRSAHAAVGTFAETNKTLISQATANKINNLDLLDVAVSTRASATQASDILNDTNYLETNLTTTRIANLDNLDATISSRATPIAVPTVNDIVTGVWDAPVGAHTVVGSFGEKVGSLINAPTLSAIVNSIWNEPKALHAIAGSFGAFLDTTISSRATQISVDSAMGALFNTATDSLHALRTKIDSLPTSAGDATLANQSAILGALATKASQSSVNTVQASVNAIPTTPLLASDVRLNLLDVAVSTRAAISDIDAIKGAGFNPLTDTLEKISDAIVASVDLTPVLAGLNDIKGVGFNTNNDSLKQHTTQINDAKVAAQAAEVAANNSLAAISTKASQVSVNAIAAAVSLIPVNTVLTSDIRLNRLDANISTRATQLSVDDVENMLTNIEGLINGLSFGDATQVKQDAILTMLNTKANDSSVNNVALLVAGIPTNPLLDSDLRLNNLDVLVSSRASIADIDSLKGIGYNPATDSLEAISNAVTGAMDLTPVMNKLAEIEGSGFTPGVDDLRSLNTIAKVERAQIWGGVESLLSTGEPT